MAIGQIIKSIERDIEEMSQPIAYPEADQFFSGAIMYAEYILDVLKNFAKKPNPQQQPISIDLPS